MATKATTGFSGRVIVNGKTLTLQKWEVVENSADLETTNFESQDPITGNCFEERIPGKIVADVTLEGYYDSDNIPAVNANGPMSAGSIMTNVDCYLDKNNVTLFYGFPKLNVQTATTTVDTMGKEARFSMKGKSNGVFTYPN